MSHAYADKTQEMVRSWRRIHANSEQTHVYIQSCGESAYIAVAADIDPREYAELDAELIAYDPALDGAIERARRWMQQNPKGIESDDSGGILRTMFKKLMDYDVDVPNEEQNA